MTTTKAGQLSKKEEQLVDALYAVNNAHIPNVVSIRVAFPTDAILAEETPAGAPTPKRILRKTGPTVVVVLDKENPDARKEVAKLLKGVSHRVDVDTTKQGAP